MWQPLMHHRNVIINLIFNCKTQLFVSLLVLVQLHYQNQAHRVPYGYSGMHHTIASSRRPQPLPYSTELFHNMLVTFSYAQAVIFLTCYGGITLVIYEVGQKRLSCVTYCGKCGVHSQWRPCFRPGVLYIKLIKGADLNKRILCWVGQYRFNDLTIKLPLVPIVLISHDFFSVILILWVKCTVFFLVCPFNIVVGNITW